MKISRSVLLAAGLTVAVVIWMLSGLVGGGSAPATNTAASSAPRQAMAVTVRESRSQPVQREISLSARSEPNRTVEVAAETEGRIVAITAERGARVNAGETIASIDMRDRKARRREAESLVQQRELEYQAAERLRGREFMSAAQIAEAAARLESARAARESIQLDIARTAIDAPFDGVIGERAVEMGDLVRVGDPVATIVDTDPLVIVGDVNEQEIQDLQVGDEGTATLLDGSPSTGAVRYISPVASDTTRTFRVELAIPNPDNRLRAGVSAQVKLPAGEVQAHRLTPALLTLNDAGQIGVKTVDERNRVQFHAVEVVVSDNRGVWVSGLPDRVRVITVGQGFVAAGETVNPVPAEQALQINEYSAPSP